MIWNIAEDGSEEIVENQNLSDSKGPPNYRQEKKTLLHPLNGAVLQLDVDIPFDGLGFGRDMRFSFRRLIYRSWFYFRQGYGTYISLPVGVASSLVVFYELAIKNIPTFRPFIPSLTVFALEALFVFVPISIALGLYHIKRTGVFATDMAIQTESNPYVYKVVPGKEQDVYLPLTMLMAKGIAKLLDRQATMNAEERKEFEEILAKANSLLEGRMIGQPRRSVGRG